MIPQSGPVSGPVTIRPQYGVYDFHMPLEESKSKLVGYLDDCLLAGLPNNRHTPTAVTAPSRGNTGMMWEFATVTLMGSWPVNRSATECVMPQ